MEKDTRKDFENDCANTPYEDYKDVDLEFIKSTRSNFLAWKAYDY